MPSPPGGGQGSAPPDVAPAGGRGCQVVSWPAATSPCRRRRPAGGYSHDRPGARFMRRWRLLMPCSVWLAPCATANRGRVYLEPQSRHV